MNRKHPVPGKNDSQAEIHREKTRHFFSRLLTKCKKYAEFKLRSSKRASPVLRQKNLSLIQPPRFVLSIPGGLALYGPVRVVEHRTGLLQSRKTDYNTENRDTQESKKLRSGYACEAPLSQTLYVTISAQTSFPACYDYYE